MPPTGIEPVPQPPEGRALSPELRGQYMLHSSRFQDWLQACCRFRTTFKFGQYNLKQCAGKILLLHQATLVQ